jgi:hypothetical protein
MLEFSEEFASGGVKFLLSVTVASALMHTAVVQRDTRIAFVNVLKLAAST